MKTRREVLKGIVAVAMLSFAAGTGLAKTTMPTCVFEDMLSFTQDGTDMELAFASTKQVMTGTLDIAGKPAAEVGDLLNVSWKFDEHMEARVFKVTQVSQLEGGTRMSMVEEV